MIRPAALPAAALVALWPTSPSSSCRHLAIVALHVEVCRSSPLPATKSSARGVKSGGIVRPAALASVTRGAIARSAGTASGVPVPSVSGTSSRGGGGGGCWSRPHHSHHPLPPKGSGAFRSTGTAKRTLITSTAGGRRMWRSHRVGSRISDVSLSLRRSTGSRGSASPLESSNDCHLSQRGDGGDVRGVVGDGDERVEKDTCQGAARTFEAGSLRGKFPLKSPLAVAVGRQQSRASFLSGVQQASIFPIVLEVGKVAVGLAAVVLGLLYINQEKMLYMPEIDGIPRRPRDNPPGYLSPEEYGIPFENERIRSEDGVETHAWFLLHPPEEPPQWPEDVGGDKEMKRGSNRPTIIFFHGNAGNIGIRLPNAQQMYELLDSNVLMVEYRGYGDSDDDRPTERGLKLDAEAALRFIRDHPAVDPDRVFIFGRSLGGAVGFHVARYAERSGVPLAGLIVENTFLSVGGMVDEVLPVLSPLKGLILKMDWDCESVAPTIVSPTLYLAGDADEIVPHWHMTGLYDASVGGSCALARIHVVKGGTHNETWLQGGSAYWESMRRFMEEALSRR